MPPSEPSLHHAQVFYPPGEEGRARAFYGYQLGLREIPRPSSLAERAGIWFEAPPGHVHLSADDDLGLHPRRHFALRVTDLDALTAHLRAAGARFEEATPPQGSNATARSRMARINANRKAVALGLRVPGWRRVYVFDPFGNKIELDEIPSDD